ncbi:MAG: methylenetetrahydrofolate reductase [Candidatus Carbobacillus altaicus]|nr:methylenetetrahydrofolate reductase [Candidatus Carbobacillus altaicus]
MQRVHIVVELDPPREPDLNRYLDAARRLQAAGVDAITIADNALAQSRVAALAASFLLKERLDMPVIVHISARDRNLLAQQSTIFGLYAQGVRDLLIVSGDSMKVGDHPTGKGVFETDSLGLMERVKRLRAGVDFFDRPLKEPVHLRFGGALNLRKQHDVMLKRLMKKYECGAEYFFSQPVYDEESMKNIATIRDNETFPTSLPVYLGLMPIISYDNARFIQTIPGVHLSQSVVESFQSLTGDDARQFGVQHACTLAKIAYSRYGFRHFYFVTPYLRASLTAALTVCLRTYAEEHSREKHRPIIDQTHDKTVLINHERRPG